jgi:hypothetical protein
MAATASKKRRWPWLVVAAVLFAAGAWLMAGTEEANVSSKAKISLPRRIAEGAPPPPPQIRDPVLAAMPTEIKKGAVVIEANAIRNSDLGNLMVDCVFTGTGDMLGRMKDAGFDPLDGVDRVAVADDAMMLTGDFSKTDFGALMGTDDKRQFGANSELITRRRADGGLGDPVGVWKNQVLVFGDEEKDVTAVLDRLDGKGDPAARRVLGESDAYGEVYGVFKPAALAESLAEENPALAALFAEAASSVKLHADVTHDVGVVADIEGSDPTKTQDLRKMLGTALTLAKLQAEAKGNKNAADVLGFARVAQAKGDSANFHVEAGIPFEFLEKHLKKCVADKKQRLSERDAGIR